MAPKAIIIISRLLTLAMSFGIAGIELEASPVRAPSTFALCIGIDTTTALGAELGSNCEHFASFCYSQAR